MTDRITEQRRSRDENERLPFVPNRNDEDMKAITDVVRVELSVDHGVRGVITEITTDGE